MVDQLQVQRIETPGTEFGQHAQRLPPATTAGRDERLKNKEYTPCG
jgi:hypothetical protein